MVSEWGLAPSGPRGVVVTGRIGCEGVRAWRGGGDREDRV